jgi:hypothetical protein
MKTCLDCKYYEVREWHDICHLRSYRDSKELWYTISTKSCDELEERK